LELRTKNIVENLVAHASGRPRCGGHLYFDIGTIGRADRCRSQFSSLPSGVSSRIDSRSVTPHPSLPADHGEDRDDHRLRRNDDEHDRERSRRDLAPDEQERCRGQHRDSRVDSASIANVNRPFGSGMARGTYVPEAC
jgi:hypothetical protein